MRIKVNSLRKFMSSFLMGIFLLATCMPATLAEEIVHFYHNDHLGSPLAMTDEDGNVVWRRDYKPFGQEIDSGGETTFNTHTYTGKEFDAGDPLALLYSPELISAQKEYLLVRNSELASAARQKLLLWGITEEQIRGIERG